MRIPSQLDGMRSPCLVFCAARKQLTSLKAVFIGTDEQPEYMSSSLKLTNFSPILAAYPNLEALHVRGGNGLEFRRVRHDNLKS